MLSICSIRIRSRNRDIVEKPRLYRVYHFLLHHFQQIGHIRVFVNVHDNVLFAQVGVDKFYRNSFFRFEIFNWYVDMLKTFLATV